MKNYKSVLILFSILLTLMLINSHIQAGEVENSVIINEVMFDPIGEDLSHEWIELYNPTDLTITMENWKVLVAGTSFKETATFSGQIPSHEYFLLCEQAVQGCNVYVAKLSLQNGGGATDAISISDNNNAVIDQVFYDMPNAYSLKDSLGNIVADNETAVIGKSGESIGRDGFSDTNVSANDFYVYASPTPGSENFSDISDDGNLPQTGDNPLYLFSTLIILIISAILIDRIKLYVFKNDKVFS